MLTRVDSSQYYLNIKKKCLLKAFFRVKIMFLPVIQVAFKLVKQPSYIISISTRFIYFSTRKK